CGVCVTHAATAVVRGRPPPHPLKIVRKTLCRDQPPFGTILRIAGGPVTPPRGSSLFFCPRNTPSPHILPRLIRAKLCDLFASILPEFAHAFFHRSLLSGERTRYRLPTHGSLCS